MSMPAFAQWRTSSYSSGNPNNCVEVSAALGRWAMRDSKLGPMSPLLIFPTSSWQMFASNMLRTASRKTG